LEHPGVLPDRALVVLEGLLVLVWCGRHAFVAPVEALQHRHARIDEVVDAAEVILMVVATKASICVTPACIIAFRMRWPCPFLPASIRRVLPFDMTRRAVGLLDVALVDAEGLCGERTGAKDKTDDGADSEQRRRTSCERCRRRVPVADHRLRRRSNARDHIVLRANVRRRIPLRSSSDRLMRSKASSSSARSCAQSPEEETKMRTCWMGTGAILPWRLGDMRMLPPL
jgi:hypothetical protein